ncbi:TM0106 family RecB-like putative nuclease [Salinactinospora qingdaonensis]|uniref:TM0106 family RecB-like putative nuclease n=1 Tax=Salinactinospora qingdaonensis TaxID=702744 RepID=A0ABP7GH08_9ACTN
MFQTDSGWVISPTDLVDALECDHRSALKAARAAGDPTVAAPTDVDALVAAGGAAHEQAHLDHFTEVFGSDVVTIAAPEATHTSLTQAAHATTEAMRAGAPVIYQGCFYLPLQPGVHFHGRADFLIWAGLDPHTGQPRPEATGYEPWDTKLAHHPGPGAIVQLSAYAEALTQLDVATGEHMYLLTGDHHTHVHRAAEFTPLLARLRQQLLHRLAGPVTAPHPLWGEPRPACEGCGYATWCAHGRAQARHLSLVAGMRSDQATKLRQAGIDTIDALARAHEQDRPATVAHHTFTRLRDQAALQVRQDATRTADNPQGEVIAEVYDHAGLAMLPEPSPGDMFFDMEGFPYYDAGDGRGLEYLFGVVTGDTATPGSDAGEHFHTFWAHNRAQEKQAFESFVDFVLARLATYPQAHIYHYASYEADRLKLLAATFATREAEVDDLLRRNRLVDLYTVVRASLRVSQRSYSIKYLEPLYGGAGRHGQVTTATSSIDTYAACVAAWQAGDDDHAHHLLSTIAAYNRDDCVSTARLRDWLEKQRIDHDVRCRPVAQGELDAEEASRSREAAQRRADIEARQQALTEPLLAGVAAHADQRDEQAQARAVLAALVGYYRREERPAWWEYFRRLAAPLEELEADHDCLVPLGGQAGAWQEPTGRQRKARREVRLRADPSRPHPFTAGEQVRLLYPSPAGQPAQVVDAQVERATAERVEVVERGEPTTTYTRLPVAVLPGPPVRATPKDTTLAQWTENLVAHLGSGDSAALPALAGLDVARRACPRLRTRTGLPRPEERDHDLVATVIDAVDDLDHSYLAVQGPPGAGKTYLAAQLITHLVAGGHTVGVCSTSHKAIENVMAAAARAAAQAGWELPAAKRPGPNSDTETAWDQPATVRDLTAWRARRDGGYLLGGTAWNFANPMLVGDPVETLIVDEAGQFALADTLAVSAASRNLVLLGDPQQLPQVVQGSHAEGAGASALEHLVGEEGIIDAARGYFLDQTRRMHPRVCAPVSQLSYRGRLRSHPVAHQRDLVGHRPGLYRCEVDHTGRATHSPEEVEAVVGLAGRLVGVELVQPGEPQRRLCAADIMVVAPFNLQVRALRQALAQAGLEGVRVGTVDRFQGQEAPVVLCSMTVSSAADVARGLDFVLSRNRLNVALSRAQVVAALVYAPGLATAAPRSVAELRALAGFAGVCAQARPIEEL